MRVETKRTPVPTEGEAIPSGAACAALAPAPLPTGTSLTAPFSIERLRDLFLLSPSHIHTLRANFVWNSAGMAVFSLCQWGILVVFAKLGSATLVGQIVYGLALTAPLFVVAWLQLRPIQATDADNRYTPGQYLGLRALTTVAAFTVALVVARIVWAGNRQLALIVLLWALSKAADAGSDALYGLFQQSERMDYVGFSLILRGLLGVAGVGVLFHASHSGPLALAGLAVAWCAVFILFDIPVARFMLRRRERSTRGPDTKSKLLRPTFDRRQLAPLCLEAAPLGVVAFLLTIQVQIPRYVVAGLLHTGELGLFSAAAYLTSVGTTLVNALGAPASVRLAQCHVTGARLGFRRLMAKLLLVAVLLGIASILVSACAGGRILALLYTPEYARMAGILTMLCAASGVSFVASFLGCGMTALRQYKVQVPIFACVVLITLVSCYCLTRRYGLMGTAVGMLLGNLGQVLMSAVVVVRTLQRAPPPTWPVAPLLPSKVRELCH